MIRFEAGGTVDPSCDRSQISYAVYLPGGSPGLVVDFSYEPKELEDLEASRRMILEALARFSPGAGAGGWEDFLPLKNLLTLSFDDAAGFRGAAHRHDPVQHLRLAGDGASPGLLPGRLPPGWLRVTISIHAVVTKACHYRLCISEEPAEGGRGQ